MFWQLMDDERLKQLFNEKLSDLEISKQMGRSFFSITNRRLKLNLKHPKPFKSRGRCNYINFCNWQTKRRLKKPKCGYVGDCQHLKITKSELRYLIDFKCEKCGKDFKSETFENACFLCQHEN